MHGAQLIFSPRQGPAIQLLGLAQGELWVGDSRVGALCRSEMGLVP